MTWRLQKLLSARGVCSRRRAEELISAGESYLFARKFSYKDSPRLVDALFEYFGTPEGGGGA